MCFTVKSTSRRLGFGLVCKMCFFLPAFHYRNSACCARCLPMHDVRVFSSYIFVWCASRNFIAHTPKPQRFTYVRWICGLLTREFSGRVKSGIGCGWYRYFTYAVRGQQWCCVSLTLTFVMAKSLSCFCCKCV